KKPLRRRPLKADPEKARAWQQKGRKRLSQKGPKRDRNREQQFGPQADMCRHLPCCVCYPELYDEEMRALEHYTPWRVSDPHHSPTVGAGGKDRDTSPCCHEHHRLLDSPNHSEESVLRAAGLPRDWFRQVAERLRGECRGNVEG